MKINIVKEGQESIGNYERVELKDNHLDVAHISDNECEFILANDMLDSFSIDKIPDCIRLAVSKLRINGTIIIGGTDIRIFARSVISGQASEVELCQWIANKQSMSSVTYAADIIKSLGLKLQSSQINGAHYEITATR